MAIKITKKTKLINEFKLPRKKKKAFKKALVGKTTWATLKPYSNLEPRAISIGWMSGVYNVYHMKKFNLKEYKGTKQIFIEE